jgi:hypothetical protein
MQHITILNGPPVGAEDSRAARPAAVRRERLFFGAIAWVSALTVFAGFMPTYYFNGVAGTAFVLTPMLYWHGALFTAWMVLLAIQTTLIATHRVDVHRTLGIVGVPLAAMMVVLGSMVAITRTQSGLIADHGAPPLVFLAVPLVGMAVFGVLVAAAIYFRRQSAIHKRLMLLATFELVTAAVSRLPLVENWGPLGFFGVTDVLVLALVVYDVASLRRIHTATLWGGIFFVASQPLRLLIGASAPWLAFTAWLTS